MSTNPKDCFSCEDRLACYKQLSAEARSREKSHLEQAFELAVAQRDEAEYQVELVFEENQKLTWMLHYVLTHDMAKENQFTEASSMSYMEGLYNTRVVENPTEPV